MLQTRLWMGAILILLGVGVLFLDYYLMPWAPVLLIVTSLACMLGSRELLTLLPAPKPRAIVCYLGVLAVVAANWAVPIGRGGNSWLWTAGALAGVLMFAFIVEAIAFRQPGGAVQRISFAFWVVGYLAFLASFLVQLRWLPDWQGSLALALAIFVPKSCDIGAYFTGRAIGRHKMTPTLSPKKTWEGAAGGLVTAVLAALGINAINPLLTWPSAIGFGIVVGITGMVGDLMESLIKRDCEKKDASDLVPGFGGVLDVVDAILFAAPVSYAWIMFLHDL